MILINTFQNRQAVFFRVIALVFALVSGTMTVLAQQTLVTFDDLTGSTIPVGYNALNWVNFGCLD
ncbi:MAG: hypothetical protein ABSA45_09345, partial [Verrucomicrobiota bacterium]